MVECFDESSFFRLECFDDGFEHSESAEFDEEMSTAILSTVEGDEEAQEEVGAVDE